MSEDVDVIEVERQRLTSRLETMPVNRITDDIAELVRSAATQIATLTPDPDRPADTVMPTVGPTALAAQLQVSVQDYLDKRTAAPEDAAVARILIDLRRNLP